MIRDNFIKIINDIAEEAQQLAKIIEQQQSTLTLVELHNFRAKLREAGALICRQKQKKVVSPQALGILTQ